MLEGLEAQVARGEAIDHSALVQGSQQLGKLCRELGFETTAPRDVPPTLEQYLASKEAEASIPNTIDAALRDPQLLGAALGPTEALGAPGWATLKAGFVLLEPGRGSSL